MVGGVMSITTTDGEEKLVALKNIVMIERGEDIGEGLGKETVYIIMEVGAEFRKYRVKSSFDVLKMQFMGKLAVARPGNIA